jgi:formylglycine-generating enzyme required for sulfatase activity
MGTRLSGGTASRWFFGDRPADLEEYAFYAVNSGEKSQPVGSKRPNPFGLFDVYGNVAEWCWDWMGDYSKDTLINPTGPKTGRYRVLRGGAWDTYDTDISSASRSAMLPEKPNKSNGFRIVRTLAPDGRERGAAPLTSPAHP